MKALLKQRSTKFPHEFRACYCVLLGGGGGVVVVVIVVVIGFCLLGWMD